MTASFLCAKILHLPPTSVMLVRHKREVFLRRTEGVHMAAVADNVVCAGVVSTHLYHILQRAVFLYLLPHSHFLFVAKAVKLSKFVKFLLVFGGNLLPLGCNGASHVSKTNLSMRFTGLLSTGNGKGLEKILPFSLKEKVVRRKRAFGLFDLFSLFVLIGGRVFGLMSLLLLLLFLHLHQLLLLHHSLLFKCLHLLLFKIPHPLKLL
mmetsp:Transcript_9004/g.11978  ORF Transcript_9004/g.11978 Transcript_9004/m.11978 type:complete len:207 (+) Transcript_9004:137-757(+)